MVKHSKPNVAGRVIMKARALRPVHFIITVILSAIIMGLTWWFWHNFEQVTRTDYALKPEAQYNPYYAAQLLINSQPNRVNSVSSDSDSDSDSDSGDYAIASTLLDSDLKYLIDNLPEIDDDEIAQGHRPTLIINSIGAKLTAARFDALRAWIEQGGHLITFAASGAYESDMQAALERLETLQEQQLDPKDIANDERLNELLTALDSGNAFLNKLGIFQVYTERASSDADETIADETMRTTEKAIEQWVEEAQNKNDAKDPNAHKIKIKDSIAKLKADRVLSLIETDDTLLMVEIAHFNDYLDSQLFQAFYPNSAQVTLQQTGDNKRLEQQATFLRDYINKSRINKSKINNSSIEQSKMNQKESKADTATDPSYSEQELDALLAAMLTLNDAALLELFYPADKLYVDATLGKGRLSVINDNQTFGNPYPSNEITDYNDDGSPKLEAISVFSAFTAPHRNSLLSADNASWLLSLTQDSSEVWILPNTDVDSLPVMLWNQARFAVLGLGLLAILWLWSLYNRFGKMAQLSSQQSRDIMRYFRQVGRFGWHQDYAEQLTKATRDKVRLLINEALSNDPVANFDNKAGIYKRHNSSSPVIINEQHLIKLHDLLTSRLHHKKTALTGLDDLNDSDHLLLTNESFIREAISLARLQNALDEQAQNHNHAYGFTQMTQTLWMIKWLLK